jgi:hypothetical protein
LIVCVWKLKGLRAPPRVGPSLNAGLVARAGESIDEFIVPKRALAGKNSFIGDNESGSKEVVKCKVRGSRRAASSSSIGVGGVGVRGGAGIGRLEAIGAVYDLDVSCEGLQGTGVSCGREIHED